MKLRAQITAYLKEFKYGATLPRLEAETGYSLMEITAAAKAMHKEGILYCPRCWYQQYRKKLVRVVVLVELWPGMAG